MFDHILTINASTYTPLNSTKIPTGKIVPVQGTPYDFTTPHAMGYKIGEILEQQHLKDTMTTLFLTIMRKSTQQFMILKADVLWK